LIIGSAAYFPWVLASYGFIPIDLGIVFLIIGGLSPTLAAILLENMENGKKGILSLFGQFKKRGFSKLWFLIVIFIPILLSLCALIFLFLLQPDLIVYNISINAVILFPAILIQNLLMNMWEEIGWRGYALSRLQQKYNMVISSFVVGFVWAIWHWPQFLVKDSSMANNFHNFFLFTIFILFISIIYSQIYNSTKGSLLTVTIFHGSINSVNILLFYTPIINFSVFPYYLSIVVIFSLGIILFKRKSIKIT
jgi:membrane protease YdiL (CAAX protease family)